VFWSSLYQTPPESVRTHVCQQILYGFLAGDLLRDEPFLELADFLVDDPFLAGDFFDEPFLGDFFSSLSKNFSPSAAVTAIVPCLSNLGLASAPASDSDSFASFFDVFFAGDLEGDFFAGDLEEDFFLAGDLDADFLALPVAVFFPAGRPLLAGDLLLASLFSSFSKNFSPSAAVTAIVPCLSNLGD